MSKLYEENNDKLLNRNISMNFDIDTSRLVYQPRQCVEKYEPYCDEEKIIQTENVTTKKQYLNIDKENMLLNLEIGDKNNPTYVFNDTASMPTTNILDQQFNNMAPVKNLELYQRSTRKSRIQPKYAYKPLKS